MPHENYLPQEKKLFIFDNSSKKRQKTTKTKKKMMNKKCSLNAICAHPIKKIEWMLNSATYLCICLAGLYGNNAQLFNKIIKMHPKNEVYFLSLINNISCFSSLYHRLHIKFICYYKHLPPFYGFLWVYENVIVTVFLSLLFFYWGKRSVENRGLDGCWIFIGTAWMIGGRRQLNLNSFTWVQ